MKLTGHACTEALNEAEEAGTRERTDDNAGGVRVERRVRRVMNEGFHANQGECSRPVWSVRDCSVAPFDQRQLS